MSGLTKDKNPVSTRLVIPSRNFYQTPLLFLYPVLSEDALKKTSFCQGEEEKLSPILTPVLPSFLNPRFLSSLFTPLFICDSFNIKHLTLVK